MRSADFCIIGGGIIGLLTARELAMAGASVTLVEAGVCGQQASWAAGGIVSPLYPWRYPSPVTALADRAQLVYPALCEQLQSDTGIDPEWQRSGLLLLDLEDQNDALRWTAAHQRIVKLFSVETFSDCQTGLTTEALQAVFFPDVAQVRNPRLLKALLADVLQRGVQVIENCSFANWVTEANQAKTAAIQIPAGPIRAGQFVVCAGAWSRMLLTPLGVDLPVTPVRGQMLMFAPHAHSLQRIVLKEGRYLIPRRDGRIICGSTVEQAGFDLQTTATARESLLQSAVSIMPSLRAVAIESHWAGLRPSSPSGVPFIGRVPQTENVWINAGHFRNGIVLAPASAELMADLLLAREPRLLAEPYLLTP